MVRALSALAARSCWCFGRGVFRRTAGRPPVRSRSCCSATPRSCGVPHAARRLRRAPGDIKVQLVEASDRTDLIARLSTSIAGGSPPDVFLINYRYYGQFAAKNAIAAARRAGSAPGRGSSTPTRLYPEALEAFRWQGRQLCLPQNVSSLVVYYNRDAVQEVRRAGAEAGLDLERAGPDRAA